MKIIQAEGQTCNQLFTYSNYLADAFEYKEKILILVPDITFEQLPNTFSNNVILYPFFWKYLVVLLGYQRSVRILSKLLLNRFSRPFLTILNLIPGVSYTYGKIGGHKSKYRIMHKENIKEIFMPNKNIIEEVNSVFSEVRQSADVIVGIHIRRGDYINFKSGQYFYSIEDYRSIMNVAQSLFPGKNVSFFISSNERINIDSFKPLNWFVLPEGDAVRDLYGLSISDYIIGPPSTFSGWASFLGEKTLYYIENKDTAFGLHDFKNILEIWRT